MSLPPLPDTAVVLGAHAADWREAVTIAGDALIRSGATEPGYTGRMINVIDEHGAYVVIAPGLALAHARPGPDVLCESISVVTLTEGVNFGHPHNDPVHVVLGLAVATPESHLTTIADIANIFNDPTTIVRLAEAGSADAAREILQTRQHQPEG